MSISSEDIYAAFELILGRSPESDGVIEHFRSVCRTREDLRSLLIRSAEFQQLFVTDFYRPPVPFMEKRDNQQVVVSASADDLERLWNHVAETWRALGRETPHFSVLTDDRFLPTNLSANEDQFWESGVHDTDRIEAIFKECGLERGNFKTALEYGCGVGRASAFLASLFDRLYALDISSYHLDIARRRSEILGLENIDYRLVDRAVLEDLPAYDLFYSRLVLQHNPPPIMAHILGKALGKLTPGGVAIFQIPVYMDGYRFETKSYLKAASAGMEMHVLPQKDIFDCIGQHGCRVLSVKEDGDIGNFGSWVSNTIVAQKNAA